MAFVLLIARPAAMLLQHLVTNQAINPGFTNLVRWQNHWHVVRQSWTFFQNDFAGRIANRVMQTGPALARKRRRRRPTPSGTSSSMAPARSCCWRSSDMRLAVPVLLWFGGYALLLRYFVPRVRERSRRMSEARSNLTGRVVDSYTNILTVKLFARPRDEDAFVRESVDEHTDAFRQQLRIITQFGMTLAVLNAAMVVGTGGDRRAGCGRDGRIGSARVAMALPLTWQISNIAGWVAQNVTTIFENVGVGAGRHALDRRAAPDAGPRRRRARSAVERGAVRFENRALRLRHRARRPARHRPHDRAGRAGRPRRPLGRRQIDPGQSAAAFLRRRSAAAS